MPVCGGGGRDDTLNSFVVGLSVGTPGHGIHVGMVFTFPVQEVIVIHIQFKHPSTASASRVVIHWSFPQTQEGLMICDYCE